MFDMITPDSEKQCAPLGTAGKVNEDDVNLVVKSEILF